MNIPMVSVILPVYNVERYLRQSLDSILEQTLTDFELICVNDGSTDGSRAILEEYAQKDARITVLDQENRGPGAARNFGFSHATGIYSCFFDADDLCSKTLLEETVARAQETEADLVVFDFIRFHEDGSVEKRVGIHDNWLPPETEVFSYRDCPDEIMCVINPTVWDKLYRTAFLRERGLKYLTITSSEDIAFSAVCAAYADRISFVKKELYQYRVEYGNTVSSPKAEKLPNVFTSITSAAVQVRALPYYNVIRKSLQQFVIENALFALKNYAAEFSAPAYRTFYEQIHQCFGSDEFAGATPEQLHDRKKWLAFLTVRKQDYEIMQGLLSRKVIISLTSFPARIHCVPSVLESIYNQTRQPDLVVLYLAEPQFPEREAELPEDLLAKVKAGRLEIHWCPDDLKPHKKYFYAMQEFPEEIIVTIDDDLQYEKTMLDSLYRSYLLYPEAVSTMRAHLVICSETGKVLPYWYWAKETDGCLNQPSLYLMATGVAGTLYPPKLLPQTLFDREAILSTCLAADDLWLKTMELMNGVPVVVACEYQGLHYVKGSQEVGLRYMNVDRNENDVQLERIKQWLEPTYGKGIWEKWLAAPGHGQDLSGIQKVCEIYTRGHEQDRRQMNEMYARLQQTYAEKSELNQKLQRTYAEKSELNQKLQRTYAEKSELNRKLQKTYAEKSEINRKLQITYDEKYDRGVQIRQLNKEIAARNQESSALRQEVAVRTQQSAALKREVAARNKETAALKQEVAALRKKNKAQEKKLNKLRNSASYRIGRAITWPVRKVRTLVKQLRK